jgi:hypothetical protein
MTTIGPALSNQAHPDSKSPFQSWWPTDHTTVPSTRSSHTRSRPQTSASPRPGDVPWPRPIGPSMAASGHSAMVARSSPETASSRSFDATVNVERRASLALIRLRGSVGADARE